MLPLIPSFPPRILGIKSFLIVLVGLFVIVDLRTRADVTRTKAIPRDFRTNAVTNPNNGPVNSATNVATLLAEFSRRRPKSVGADVAGLADQRSSVSLFADGESENPDSFSEQERERMEMGLEQPEERQKFFLQKRSPDGVSPLPMEKYVKALDHMEQMPQYSTVAGQMFPSRSEKAKLGAGETNATLGTWSSLGPGNIGGRTRALLIHPINPAIMYAAAVSGGIWKSTDAGASWAPLADLMANINVCTLAMDPHNPNEIYAGTGEAVGSALIIGAGIFKTTDGGTTWSQLSATKTSDFQSVSKIVVSPLVSNRVYAATNTGVWRSTNSGLTWVNVLPVLDAVDLVIRTDQPTDVVLVTAGISGNPPAAIYRNLDAGGVGSWIAVYTEPNMGRTSLAIAPSNQGTMYALATSREAGPYLDGLLAVLQSTDGGGTWTARVRNTNPVGQNTCLLSACGCTSELSYSQGGYDNVIAVDPLDSNRVWAGGIYMWRSDDGAATWGLANGGMHLDQHVIVFHPQFNGTTNQQMFVGNDGGIWRTDSERGMTEAPFCSGPKSTVNWTNLNNGYGATQFYFGLPYPGGATYFGGTQDNGTIRGADGGPNAWTTLLGGDGGWVAFDPSNTNVLYGETFGLSISKSTDGGTHWQSATSGIDPSGPVSFINPFIMDPSNRSILWTGTVKPWRTTNAASNWNQAGAAFSGGAWATAIAVAPTDSNYVLFGLARGAIANSHTALTDDSTKVWAQVRPVQFGYVSGLTFDPTNKNIAYATYATFGVPHVWKSVDGGSTFSNISGTGITGIPDIPVHSIVVDPANTARLYIGTDLGVFTSIDGGAHWAVETTGFANVITESLAVTGDKIFAFTHGRGAYRVSNAQTLTVSKGGTGTGTVTSSPSGIACGATCWAVFNAGTVVTLTPSADAGSIFTGWAGDCTGSGACQVTISQGQARNVAATFTSTEPQITVQTNPAGRTFTVDGVNYSETRVFSWTSGSSHTLSTTSVQVIDPFTAFFWQNWSDGGGIAHTVTAPSSDTTYTANFTQHPNALQFSSATYTVNESGGFLNVAVNRSGDSSGAASVIYATSNGSAKEGKDYVAAQGVLNFAAGETGKTFTVLVIDNAFVDLARTVNLTLTNISGASLGTPNIAVLTIIDNDIVAGPNPIDTARSFVQYHYYDFLGRYPDQSGWDFWTNNITGCSPQPSCIEVQRINTSAAYFLSIEFQQTGYLVYRIYKASFGNLTDIPNAPVPIKRQEFLPDTQEIGNGVIVNQGNWQQQLEANKQGFTLEFVQRTRFTSAFPMTMTPAQYVDKLFLNAGVTPTSTDRNAAIAEFGSASISGDVAARSRALRDVAENTTLSTQEFNKAFVLMQYFGYLRRNPYDPPEGTLDYSGFNFWLGKLNSFNGNYINAEMVKAFISSDEYRHRFGP